MEEVRPVSYQTNMSEIFVPADNVIAHYRMSMRSTVIRIRWPTPFRVLHDVTVKAGYSILFRLPNRLTTKGRRAVMHSRVS